MTNQLPTPYPALNEVLRDMVASNQTILGDKCVGIYLQGSLAVGDFDQHSDVDYIIALHEDLAHEQVAALDANQARIRARYDPWGQHLECSYFPLDVLRDYRQSGGLVWYFDHGATTLIRSNHCNTALVRWVVRDMGITLAGPDPQSLIDPIPVAALRKEILSVIRGWGGDLMIDPEPYNNRFYQSFIVLNYCRMLHDLRRGRPGSKLTGITWAKANLDPAWTGLIDRAWITRKDAMIWQQADQDEFKASLEFVRYIMQQAEQYAAENGLG
ncbi:MAG: DUF4111 domain-containing protein [Anaerolineae bacterium]|nr:DUF4111 domain-containing protein [Anaerolineae bacterium]